MQIHVKVSMSLLSIFSLRQLVQYSHVNELHSDVSRGFL